MRVQFEFSHDDLIDAAQRFLGRSKVAWSWKWKGLFYSSLFAWLLVFVFFLNAPLKGLMFGLIAAAVSAAIF